MRLSGNNIATLDFIVLINDINVSIAARITHDRLHVYKDPVRTQAFNKIGSDKHTWKQKTVRIGKFSTQTHRASTFINLYIRKSEFALLSVFRSV